MVWFFLSILLRILNAIITNYIQANFWHDDGWYWQQKGNDDSYQSLFQANRSEITRDKVKALY